MADKNGNSDHFEFGSRNVDVATNAAITRARWAIASAIVTVLFGILTVLSDGCVLSGGATARAAVGNAVEFVLWFNFVFGFFYVLADISLFLWRRWSVQLTALIAIATVIIFAAFG